MRRLPRVLLWLLALAGLAPAGEGAPGPKATPEPPFPPVSRLASLRGDVRPLPDGRLELYYDWRGAAQLQDWRVVAGAEPQVAEGELRLGSGESHTLRHVGSFLGVVEVAGACRVREGLGIHGHFAAALCAAPWRGYWLVLRDGRQDIYREGVPAAFLAMNDDRLRDNADHTFHLARLGNLVQAWIDESVHLRGRDAALHQGSVLLRAWRARAGVRGVWLLGRPDPRWLAANPGVAGQLEALRVYAGGAAALRPLWEASRHAAALARARALVKEEPYAQSPAAAKWMLEDAQALAGLWQAAEAGLATLKPGDALRAGGAEAAFQRREGGLVVVRVNGTDLPKKLASFQGEELLALAARARPAEAGRDRLAAALLRLHGSGAAAAVRAELLGAERAGADVARHLGLVIPRPGTAAKAAPPQPVTGEKVTYAGKPLFIEAEAAVQRLGAMQVERDDTASGDRFVWEPRGEGDSQYGKPSSRVVFHILVQQPATVYLWARVRSASTEANSFLVAVAPEGAESPSVRPWHLTPQAGWHWEPYNAASRVDAGSSQPSPVQLQPGVNAVIIAVRERGVALDKLYLSEGPEPPAP
ncbi:MAG TPA: hypothetical protein VNE39_00365 [Planctomycetota bacterium]|nr:hypothetical protein [Planctomycetota bacterium]